MRHRAFTLIEILVATAIILSISALVIYSARGIMRRTQTYQF